MVRKFANLFLAIAFVASLLAVKTSSSSPIKNEILEILKAELQSLRVKVDLLEAKNAENEAKIDLQEAKNVEQENEIIKLKTKLNAKLESDHSSGLSYDETVIHPLGALIDERSLDYIENKDAGLLNNRNRRGSSGDSSTRATVPSSCRELALVGHSIDGLYLVQNPDSRKIETVYCDFGTSIFQERIGNVDIKTRTVHFYVARNTSFSTPSAVIPFDVARLNEGGAMNLASGIFTAPVPGIYHFEFSGVKDPFTAYMVIDIQVNGARIGFAYTSQNTGGSMDAVCLSASLRLAANDKVNLYNYNDYGMLYGNNGETPHFTGWLVEEDLI